MLRPTLILFLVICQIGAASARPGLCSELLGTLVQPRHPRFWQIPDPVTGNNVHCGPACFQSVLTHLGVPFEKNDLAARLGTSVPHGTTIDAMVAVARQYGLDSNWYYSNLAEVQRYHDEGVSFVLYWHHGNGIYHYSVFEGSDANRVYMMDPLHSEFRLVSEMTQTDFFSRWDGRVIWFRPAH